ncbi:MAG: tetraacyldisaccharide 4'-kinase [Candidatus Eiseniibacteriota bacterium]
MSYPVTDLRGLRRPGALPASCAVPASWLFALGVRIHQGLHDRGLLPRRRLGPMPVVSVGALTAGGAGKTPMTRWLAARLLERGHRPAILTRGSRSAGGGEPRVVDAAEPDVRRDGDEPALLARTLPAVPVVVSPDRARGAALARDRGADIVLLDDGFQHRRLARDVDLVLWDRAAESSRGRLLPRGLLREPLAALRRADVLVLVDRGEGAPALPPGAPGSERVFWARLVPVARQLLAAGRAVHALSGIADAESFERSLIALGLRVTGATRFEDHHAFSAEEVREAAARAAREGADFLAVTAKDHVRWPKDGGGLPVPAVLDVDVEVDAGDRLVRTIVSLWEEGGA